MEIAIKRAIEGGFNDREELSDIYYKWRNESCKSIFLDHNFWKSLGKYEGWETVNKTCTSGCGCEYGSKGHERECVWEERQPEWLYNWHLFIDYIAKIDTNEEKNDAKYIDNFFEKLLK